VTLGEMLDALAARGSRVAADGGRLRHIGPRFAEGDPLRRALATFHDEIVHLIMTGRLCCFCPRLLVEGDLIACPEHRAKIEETPMPWDQANTVANGEGEACRNINGVCENQAHEHFDFDEFFDDFRAEQEDRYLEYGARPGAA
jgi:hypothetical protein